MIDDIRQHGASLGFVKPQFGFASFVFLRQAEAPRADWKGHRRAISYCCCEDLARNLAQAEVDLPIRLAIVQLRDPPRVISHIDKIADRRSPFDHACAGAGPSELLNTPRLLWERDGRL